MNFREVINEVLTRMREENAPSWSGTILSAPNVEAYHKAVAALVNDSKEYVESSHEWTALRDSVDITTVSGTTVYELDVLQGSRILDVTITDENNSKVKQVTKTYMNSLKYPTVITGLPSGYRVKGVTTNDKLNIEIVPSPTKAMTIRFDVVKAQPTLTDETDILKVPSSPVVIGAWARAVAERGEDGGSASPSIMTEAQMSLTKSIQVDNGYAEFESDWYVR